MIFRHGDRSAIHVIPTLPPVHWYVGGRHVLVHPTPPMSSIHLLTLDPDPRPPPLSPHTYTPMQATRSRPAVGNRNAATVCCGIRVPAAVRQLGGVDLQLVGGGGAVDRCEPVPRVCRKSTRRLVPTKRICLPDEFPHRRTSVAANPGPHGAHQQRFAASAIR
jgi:hypothetical protein